MPAVEIGRTGGQGTAVADSLLRTPSGQLLGLAGVLLAGLLVHLVALVVVLRWHGRWMARHVRAEVARLPTPGLLGWTAVPAGHSPAGSAPLLLPAAGAAAAETPGPGPAVLCRPAPTQDADFWPGEEAGRRQERRPFLPRRWAEEGVDGTDRA